MTRSATNAPLSGSPSSESLLRIGATPRSSERKLALSFRRTNVAPVSRRIFFASSKELIEASSLFECIHNRRNQNDLYRDPRNTGNRCCYDRCRCGNIHAEETAGQKKRKCIDRSSGNHGRD